MRVPPASGQQVQPVCGGDLKFHLETTLGFLKHDEGSKSLFLDEANIKKEATYDDSYLQITIDKHQLKLPVVVSFVSCKIESLRFKKQAIALEYKVGSGDATLPLPELI